MSRAALLILSLALLAGCRTVASDLEDLGSEEYEDRQEAVISIASRLRAAGPAGLPEGERARMVDGLRTALGDTSPIVRSVAIGALESLGDKESAARIALLLKDHSWLVRISAIEALRTLEAASEVRAISGVLRDDSNAHCRREAARTIGSFRSPEGFEACLAALSERETDANVRFAAWEALKAITGEDLPGRYTVWLAWRDAHKGGAAEAPR